MARLLVLIITLFPPAVALSAPLPTGQMDYRVSWNGISAGSATVEVTRAEQDRASIYRVDAAIQTSWLVDLLWRLRAHALSSFTADQLAPLGFRYDRDVNREHSITDITFEPSGQEAEGRHYRGGEIKVVDVHDAGVLDPVTAIFRALTEPFRNGDTLRYEVFTGEARYRVELHVEGEDLISIAAGTYRAWRVVPRIWKLGSGLDQRLRDATIWVSQQPVRTVLRIRSDVFIGAVNCDLQRLPAPADQPSAPVAADVPRTHRMSSQDFSLRPMSSRVFNLRPM
jgi:hypothetical protein